MSALMIGMLVLLAVSEILHYRERQNYLRDLRSRGEQGAGVQKQASARAVNAMKRNIKEHERRIRERY